MSAPTLPVSQDYQPPLTASVNSMLIQDFVSSARVLVDTSNASAVAPFFSAVTGQPAAYVITPTGPGGTGELNYLVQDPSAVYGWSLTGTLPGQPAEASGPFAAQAVVVAVSPTAPQNGRDVMFYLDLGGNLHICPPSGPWSVYPVDMAGLQVAYTRTADGAQRPLVYGLSSGGDQLFLYQPDASSPTGWASSWMALPTPVTGSYVLTATLDAEPDFILYGMIGGQLQFYSGTFGQPSVQLKAWTGPLSSTPLDIVGVVRPPALGSLPVPVYVDVNGIPFMAHPTLGSVVIPINTPGRLDTLQLLPDAENVMATLYAADDELLVSVVVQIGWLRDGNLPHWAPSVPITAAGGGGSAVYASSHPLDPETMVIADAAGELTLYTYGDAAGSVNGRWTTNVPKLAADLDYEETNYHTSVQVLDARGLPVANYPLTVSSTDIVSIRSLSSLSAALTGPGLPPFQTYTDVTGTLTVVQEAISLSPPHLIITDPLHALNDVSVAPGGAVQSFLGGAGTTIPHGGSSATGTLNYLSAGLQDFTPDMIATAKDPGTGAPLFPGVQPDHVGGPLMSPQHLQSLVNDIVSAGARAQGVAGVPAPRQAGYILSTLDPGRPGFQSFDALADFEAELALRPSLAAPAFLGGLGHLIADTFTAIGHGIAHVAAIAVDTAKGVVTHLVAKVGTGVVHLENIAVKTFNDAFNVATAVFDYVKAEVSPFLRFARAAMDFGAVVNTQKVLFGQLQGFQPWAERTIASLGNYLNGQNGFFSKMTSDVKSAFGNAASTFSARTCAGAQGWTTPGSPNNSKPIAGTGTRTGAGLGTGTFAFSPDDLTNSPAVNWIANQITPHLPTTSGAGLDAEGFDIGALTGFNNVWESLGQVLQDFKDAAQDAWDGIKSLPNFDPAHPATIQNVDLGAFLEAVGEIVEALLALLDAFVIALLDLLKAGVDGLGEYLFNELSSPLWAPVRLVYDKIVGDSGPVFSIAGLTTLMLAWPVTVTYRLAYGSQPFPDGALPDAAAGGGLAAGGSLPTKAPITYQWVVAIGNYVSTIMSGASSALSGVALGTALSVISYAWKIPSYVFAWPNGKPYSGIDHWDFETKLLAIAFVGGMAPFLLFGMFAAYGKELEEKAKSAYETYRMNSQLVSTTMSAAMAVGWLCLVKSDSWDGVGAIANNIAGLCSDVNGLCNILNWKPIVLETDYLSSIAALTLNTLFALAVVTLNVVTIVEEP